MTNLSNEFQEISDAETGPVYIKEPGVKLVTIKDYKLSEDNKDYKGNPYLEISFEDGTGAINNAKFYRTKDGDSEDAKRIKTKILKEFLVNANVDQSKIKDPKAYLNSIKGNKIKVFFRTEEYVTVDKNNFNEPVIRDIVKYGWSSKENEEIYGNQSHLRKPLNSENMSKYEYQLEQWKKDNANRASAVKIDNESPESESDDLPF